MRVFFAFPGQGTQRPGILHGLNTFGLSVLEEMSNAIGLVLLKRSNAQKTYSSHFSVRELGNAES